MQLYLCTVESFVISKSLFSFSCNVWDIFLFLCRCQSSIQITFDSSLQLSAASAIESVTCTDQSANRMVSNFCIMFIMALIIAAIHFGVCACVWVLSRSPLIFQVLHCNCSVDRMAFPVTVTQQSPAAISMDTYQITIAPAVAKVPKQSTWIFLRFALGKSDLLKTNVGAWFALLFKCENLHRRSHVNRAIGAVVIKCEMFFFQLLPDAL